MVNLGAGEDVIPDISCIGGSWGSIRRIFEAAGWRELILKSDLEERSG
jgi:hypothetical protein